MEYLGLSICQMDMTVSESETYRKLNLVIVHPFILSKVPSINDKMVGPFKEICEFDHQCEILDLKSSKIVRTILRRIRMVEIQCSQFHLKYHIS